MEIENSNTAQVFAARFAQQSIEVVDSPPLSTMSPQDLLALAKRQGSQAMDFAKTLAYIRVNQSWRNMGLPTWEAFCAEIGYSRRHINRIIKALNTESEPNPTQRQETGHGVPPVRLPAFITDLKKTWARTENDLLPELDNLTEAQQHDLRAAMLQTAQQFVEQLNAPEPAPEPETPKEVKFVI